MEINLKESILSPYVESEYASENLDAIINQCYLPLSIDKKTMESLLSQYDASNAYRSLVLKQMNLEEKQALAEIAVGFGLDEIEALDEKEVLENPYYQALKNLKPFKEGNISFGFDEIPAYSLFINKDKGYDEQVITAEKTYLAYCPFPLAIPTLRQKDLRWMSLVPHELHTMAKPIENASGDVLVYGAGLGYFAYMVSLKEDVRSVTIVEKDPLILSLFKKRFLLLFEHKDKVSLMEGDALSFNPDKPYDYCFIDIYHGAEDGLELYCRLLHQGIPAKHYDFWIEKGILAYFRRYVALFLEEIAFMGYEAEEYAQQNDFPSFLLNRIYELTKTMVIDNEEQLQYLLSDAQLKALASKIYSV